MSSIFVVLSKAIEGQEADFNNWWDNDNLPAVRAIDGIASARRYQLTNAGEYGPPPPASLAIYELDAPPAEVEKNLEAAAKDGRLFAPPSLDHDSARFWTYETVSD